MDELLEQLKSFNRTLQKLADFFIPEPSSGLFEAFEAFKVFSRNGRLLVAGIAAPDPVCFEELKGIDPVIARLRQNSEQFLAGLPCNNLLLYGPRGTGKSSAIKAAFNEYRRMGLRMIEMPRDALFHLFEVAEVIKGRPERFIVFCDDLSFDEDESSYRQLKAILEGGLEMRPENMLIYATSNRRHLMPERTSDNQPVYSGGELHPSETLEEKLSLSDRFGLRLGLSHFDRETYLEIISNYMHLRNITVDPEELSRKALQWSLSHGSYSGRTARQFVDDLEGNIRMEKEGRRVSP